METTILGVLGLIVTIATFLYGVYRVTKKDSDVRRDKVVAQVEECIRENTATKESIKRVNQRIDSIEEKQEKLESTVEKMMDKLDNKLDKIMDFLLESRG